MSSSAAAGRLRGAVAGVASHPLESGKRETTEMVRAKGFGAIVHNSIEDFADRAQVERPHLARLTADGPTEAGSSHE